MPFGDWNTSEYWDATANKPKLTSGKGVHGQGYLVGTSGSTNLDGNTGWQAGDVAIFLLDKWVRVSASGAGGSANPAGADGDIQTKSGTGLAAITRAGGVTTDYLARDNTYKTFSGGGGTFSGTGDPGLTRAQAITTTFTTPPAAIRTIGYDTPDDNGGGLYVKVSSQPDHAGKFQTADGTWYELKHEYGRVWTAQFGAKSNTPANWNARTNDIGPFLNAAVDYIVFNRFGVCDLHIHGGFYYQTETCQLKGASFNVRGVGKGGTFIMPQEYVTGFVGHHPSFSFETFGSIYFGNRSFAVGETFFTSGGTVGTASGRTYICTVAGTVSVDGSQKPTGTGTGYVDGTATFDYHRDATRVELTGQGWSGELSNLSLYSHFDGTSLPSISGLGAWTAQINAPAVGPWPQFPSGQTYTGGPWKPSFGFLGRVRAHVHHVDMSGFSAHGCAFIANGDQDFPTITGNVNFWCVTDSSFYYNAMDGLHVSYSDGNAGYASHIDVASNGRWGIRDQSFLGNMYVQVQSATDGRTSLTTNKRFPASVAYSGYRYYALLGHVGVSATPDWGAVAPTPGASNNAWQLIGAGVTDNWDFPDYVSGAHYEPSGCYGADQANARNLWNSCYIEGGTNPAQFNSRDIVIGGLMQGAFIGAGENILNDGNWYNSINYISRAHNFNVSWGSGGPYSEKGEGLWNLYDGTYNKNYSFRSDSYSNDGATYNTDNWGWFIDNFRCGYWIRSNQNSKFYGEPTALTGGQFAFHELYVGSDGDCRKLDYADSKPTDGTGGRGARVYNRQADVGQVEGWICCGTGRVWKNMRTIT